LHYIYLATGQPPDCRIAGLPDCWMADGDCAAPGHNVDATTIADAKSKRYRWMMSGHRGKSYSFKGKQSEALNFGYKVGTIGEAQTDFSILFYSLKIF